MPPIIRRTWTVATSVVTALLLSVTPASAQSLQYLGQFFETGGGPGRLPTILMLQRPGGTSKESGCVGPTRFDNCGFANGRVQQGQSQLRPVAEFPDLTGSNFRLIFNAVEPGNDKTITINSLVLTLYGSGTQTFSASLGEVPLTLNGTGNGMGNYGHSFGLSSATWSAFDAFVAANPTARIGLGATLTHAQGGPEAFSIGMGPSTVVPEPSTYLLMAVGLAGLGAVARRRTKFA
jgi:hypothetical protein